jgi:hypothetical protein
MIGHLWRASVLSFDGLGVCKLEVCCPEPSPEAANYAIEVSSQSDLAPWYVRNRQVDEDLGIPFFADHIKALTGSLH